MSLRKLISARSSAAGLFFVSLTLCVATPGRVDAFKMETHVWIAQEILNDVLPDGKVTIEPFGEFEVDPEVVDALRNHPDHFRMGTIGPDGFPDLIGGQMVMHPGLENGWQSDEWLHWVLSEANKPAQVAFAYGYILHAAADIWAHTYVNTYCGDHFDLTVDQEVELRHVALEEYIARRQPKIVDNDGTVLNARRIVKVPAAFVRDTLILNKKVANQYRKQTATLYLAAMYDYRKKIDDAIAKAEEILDPIRDAIDEIEDIIDGLDDAIDDFKDTKLELCLPQVCLFGICTPKICISVKPWPTFCFVVLPLCAAIEATQLVLDATREALDLPRFFLDLGQKMITLGLEAWASQVDEAIKQYIKTSEQVVKELLRGENGDPIQPLEDWACNWAPAFLPIPNAVVQTGCAAKGVISEAQEFFDRVTGFRSEIADALGGGVFEWLLTPDKKAKELVEGVICELQGEFADLAGELVAVVTGLPTDDFLVLREVIGLRGSEATATNAAATLTEIFQDSTSSKKLLKIGDIVERVDADMHLSGGDWDPEQFLPIRNSIVLSKLALLGPAEVNRMVHEVAGVGDTAYGKPLYAATDPFNVLFAAVRSIDGSHQWQETSLPYPRRNGNIDKRYPEERHYGYEFDAMEGSGFRLWQACNVREKVFLEIFRGPLAPGIEEPSIHGLEEPVGLDDPIVSTADDPYPISDHSEVHDCDVTIWDFIDANPPMIVFEEEVILDFLPTPGVFPCLNCAPLGGGGAGAIARPDPVGLRHTLGGARAIDDFDLHVKLTSDAPDVFPLGTTPVTWTATDKAGNVSRTVQRVTVVDRDPPQILDELPDLVTVADGRQGTQVQVVQPLVHDASGGSVSVELETAFDSLAIGQNEITWIATDEAGNVTRVEQTITVERLDGDLDVDGDVDADDFRFVALAAAAGEQSIVASIELADFDGDGRITETDREIHARIRRTAFDPRDLDSDGLITQSDARKLLELCSEPDCNAGHVAFLRGDANEDGEVDISDAVTALIFLFIGGATPPDCLKSLDADDNGAIEISDPISLLDFLFRTGGAPMIPFGECGLDLTPDELTCDRFEPCSPDSGSLPDLRIQSFRLSPRDPNTLTTRLTVQASVVNDGDGVARPSIAGILLGDGTRTFRVPALEPGEAFPLVATQEVSLEPGELRVGVEADRGDRVGESNEQNNARSVRLTIAEPPPGPLLAVVGLRIRPEPPAPGEPFTIIAVVENRGTEVSPEKTGHVIVESRVRSKKREVVIPSLEPGERTVVEHRERLRAGAYRVTVRALAPDEPVPTPFDRAAGARSTEVTVGSSE